MVAPRSTRPTNTSASLARRLAWPTAISLALAAVAACGGSSDGDNGSDAPSAGTSGSLGVSGSSNTTGGKSSGSSGSSTGGKATGGNTAQGGESTEDPGEGGSGPGAEGGAPGHGPGPMDPPDPPGMGGDGAGGAGADCPMAPPADKAKCATEMLKCEYPTLSCNCEGPEQDRKWKCKEVKPMDACPPMAPKDGGACETAEPPAPPCHYEKADCACTADKWACVEVEAP